MSITSTNRHGLFGPWAPRPRFVHETIAALGAPIIVLVGGPSFINQGRPRLGELLPHLGKSGRFFLDEILRLRRPVNQEYHL